MQRADQQLPYDHGTYWPAVVNACLQRRQEHLDAWRELGPPRVGRSERDFKKSSTMRRGAAATQ